MRTLIVAPRSPWPEEKLRSLVIDVQAAFPFLSINVANAASEMFAPTISPERAAPLAVLDPIVVDLDDPRGKFRLFRDASGRRRLSLPGRVPDVEEMEGAAFRALYVGDDGLAALARRLLAIAGPRSDVMIVFRNFHEGELHRRQIVDKVAARLGHLGRLVLAVDDFLVDEYARQFPEHAVEAWSLAFRAPERTVWVIAVDRGAEASVSLPDPSAANAARIFVASPQGILVPHERRKDGSLVPRIAPPANDHVDETVFSRLTPTRTLGSWWLTPFGYGLTHANGIGPLNSFGLGIAHDFSQLANRDPDHLLIAVFGGSAVHAVEMPHHLTFPYRLEEILRAQGRRVSVLNFGLSACHTLNQLSLYLLFAEAQRPEIVIAHDGFNDLAIGMTNDPALINRYAASYPPNFESWGAALLGRSDALLSQVFDGRTTQRVLSSPQAVCNAYLQRRDQFRRVVEGLGTTFIAGLQPVAFGKSLSPLEQEVLETFYRQNAPYRDVFRLLPVAYERVQQHLLAEEKPGLDIHALFAQASPDEHLFSDIVHLTAAGNERVAAVYAERIVSDLSTRSETGKTTT